MDHVKEIETLANLNKKLSEEKTSLQSELTSLDDLVQQIKSENCHLRTTLKTHQHTLDTVTRFELECEDLKSEKNKIEER